MCVLNVGDTKSIVFTDITYTYCRIEALQQGKTTYLVLTNLKNTCKELLVVTAHPKRQQQ